MRSCSGVCHCGPSKSPVEQGRKGDLAGVKAKRGRGIHPRVGVMDTVEPPQQRDLMIRAVPDIHPDVEQQESRNHGDRCRHVDGVQKTPAARLRKLDRHEDQGCHQGTHQTRHERETDIPSRVGPASGGLIIEGDHAFQCEQRRQNRETDPLIDAHRRPRS